MSNRLPPAGLRWPALALVALLAAGCGSTPPGNAGAAFERGYPTAAAARAAQDEADFQRAVTAYRFWYPTVSTEGIFNGNRAIGLQDNQGLGIASTGPRQVGFTLNSDTPYGSMVLDVSQGPWVVELPPGPFIGLVDDHHQRWILDMGIPGPDAGKGGKHLILPPGYTGTVPAGYHVGRAKSNKLLLAVRSLPARGDLPAALQALRTVKIYPLSAAANPPPLKVVDSTTLKMDSTSLAWEDNLQFWQVLHRIIDAEPIVDEFRPMYGLLSALGIEKGKPFTPDDRLNDVLTRAAKTGRDQMLVSAFATTRKDAIAWPDRKWEWVGLVPTNGDFETPLGLDLEARDRWFAQAIVASPAMFRRTPGGGSLYWLGLRDGAGAYLDGGRTYKLTIPQPVPGQLFWSITLYDAQTRSQVQTDHDKAALRSLFELKGVDTTKPLDLYFGPSAPAGAADRWIKTAPGRGWFAYIRIYGPEQAAFDGQWKPGDFQRVD